MDLDTQNHLVMLRQLLLHRQRELSSDVHAAELERQQAEPVGMQEVFDQKDAASYLQSAEVDTAQERLERDELAAIDAALQRLDNGSYGDCVDCGNPIPLPRLMVQPGALRCAACQSAHEGGRAQRP
ncbi:MAG: TraR/DksA family transcriptional regulator [Proteobacteria bacterium]|nr:TraR/DksA family transcriptional regulator [Pseudomonadota bacterium]